MFYHRESVPDERDSQHGCPQSCPTGLFAGELFCLVANENHRSKPFDPSRDGFIGHGKSGMVYWSEKSLKLVASKQEVEISGLEDAA